MVSDGIANPSKMLNLVHVRIVYPPPRKGDNMKKVYEELKIDVIVFNTSDIITSSPVEGEIPEFD